MTRPALTLVEQNRMMRTALEAARLKLSGWEDVVLAVNERINPPKRCGYCHNGKQYHGDPSDPETAAVVCEECGGSGWL